MRMQFKEGDGWKACFDESTGRYTAERGGCGYYHLYEITEEIFEALADDMRDEETYKLIDQGRHLYMDVNDRCGPPYTVVFDDDYRELCPWAHIVGGEAMRRTLHEQSIPLGRHGALDSCHS